MNLFGRHITGLADFSGRENRQPFWLWILIVYAIQMVLSMIVMVPLMMSMFDRMAPFAQGDPHRFDDRPDLMFQTMAPVMTDMMSHFMIFTAVFSVLWLLLIGAAVTRRLHDSDRSGWWAAPVFALHVVMPLVYASVFPRFFQTFGNVRDDMTPDQMNAVMAPAMQSMMSISLLGMLGFLAMIVLVVFLCLAGTPGRNRYGPDPLASF